MMIRLPSSTTGTVPFIQLKSRKEPLAEQVRTTVLLRSNATGMLDLMTTSDTGSVQRHKEVVETGAMEAFICNFVVFKITFFFFPFHSLQLSHCVKLNTFLL